MATLYAWKDAAFAEDMEDYLNSGYFFVYTSSQNPTAGDNLYDRNGNVITSVKMEIEGEIYTASELVISSGLHQSDGLQVIDLSYSLEGEDFAVEFDRYQEMDVEVENSNYISTFTHSGVTYTLKDAQARAALDSKADTDLSNIPNTLTAIPPISLKNFDGQWVAKQQTLSTATALGSYTYDLSNYLPDDNYSYEVALRLVVNSSKNTGLYVGTIASPADNINQPGFKIGAATANSFYGQCCATLPVDSTRLLYGQIETTSATTGAAVYVYGYRRTGTNI